MEITLDPALALIGNSTTYKILVNATDDDGNNASSNILYYTLTLPAITLVSPSNNYWDADGNISFSFKVLDEAYQNISCSLYLNDVLNQTNDTTISDDTIAVFNVTGIAEGANQEWKISCSDVGNNTGESSRIFNVDKTNPVVNWVNDTPDPVGEGAIINLTANITDNFVVDYAEVNVSGTVYHMIYAGNDIYYYELNVTYGSGNYNYSVLAYDNADNLASQVWGNFTVDNSTPLVFGLVPVAGSNYNISDTIEISANVTEDYPDTVYVNITYPNTTVVRLDLSNALGGKYNNSFIIPNVAGQYNLSFFANDSVGNINDTEASYFVTSSLDSCTYSDSGNWEVDCSDNCLIDSSVDLLGNNVSIIGSGSFVATADITNFTDLYIAGASASSRCEVYCSEGGCFI